jgi:hypothetical protein
MHQPPRAILQAVAAAHPRERVNEHRRTRPAPSPRPGEAPARRAARRRRFRQGCRAVRTEKRVKPAAEAAAPRDHRVQYQRAGAA